MAASHFEPPLGNALAGRSAKYARARNTLAGSRMAPTSEWRDWNEPARTIQGQVSPMHEKSTNSSRLRRPMRANARKCSVDAAASPGFAVRFCQRESPFVSCCGLSLRCDVSKLELRGHAFPNWILGTRRLLRQSLGTREEHVQENSRPNRMFSTGDQSA